MPSTRFDITSQRDVRTVSSARALSLAGSAAERSDIVEHVRASRSKRTPRCAACELRRTFAAGGLTIGRATQ